MMQFDFDKVIERQNTDSVKWRAYPPDVLPLWVADMDFAAPPAVIDALRARVEHGIFGYGVEPERLRELIVARMARLYGWEIKPCDVLFVPGVVTGFNWFCNSLADAGEGALVQTPVYPPLLQAPLHANLLRQEMQLTRDAVGCYSIDMEAFESAITPATRLFLLCNPHNPVGRVFSREELTRMAEICLKHDLFICSDEIHCDLLLNGRQHVPIASIAPEIAARTVTLIAPSKTFNIAGLHGSVAIVQNADLRARLDAGKRGLVSHVSILAFTAAVAAYESGEEWLAECLAYLQENYEYLTRRVAADLPGLTMSPMEGTYLAWLDCRSALADPYPFFRDQARVALNDGAAFGRGGEGFVRLNFGCPRSILAEALDRMAAALHHHTATQAQQR